MKNLNVMLPEIFSVSGLPLWIHSSFRKKPTAVFLYLL